MTSDPETFPGMNRLELADLIDQLRDNLKEDPESWENPDLDRFLESLAAWTRDMDGVFLNRGEPLPEVPSWELIADMLLAAKIYE
ncbi:hypothetical protein ACIQC5_08800 [Paenarthrobacter sp. NPDC092416]|uniref:DUF7660 family protein n=1 Tax=Paenarthrobacter sp. NPDC092416 TaxID=3364386 RepID=UPI0037F8B9DD